jgi:uncharacterized membrane protein
MPTSSQQQPRRTERGASELMILIFMTAMLAFAGLAYDAGMAFNARRQAQNVAHAAARVGANEVEPDSLYLTGLPLLDSSDARGAARKHIEAAGLKAVQVDVRNGFQIQVTVEAVHNTTFLQIVGIDTMTVRAESKVMAESFATS